MYTSVASMITRIVRKHFGMLACTTSLGGHNGISFSFKYMKLIHVVNILDIVAQDNPNRSARSCSRSPSLSLTSTRKTLQLVSKFVDDPSFLLHKYHQVLSSSISAD